MCTVVSAAHFALVCSVLLGCSIRDVEAITTVVTSYTDLVAAIANYADLDVQSDILVSSEIWIPPAASVTVTSSTGASISGGGASRIFSVEGALDLSFLTLTDGSAPWSATATGGAVQLVSSGKLTANECTFSANTAYGGGAIGTQSSSDDDDADSLDDAADYDSRSDPEDTSSLTLWGCTFVLNSANQGGAVAVWAPGTTLIFDLCIATNNTGNDYGGAISSSAKWATATISRSAFTSNTAARKNL